MQFSAFCIAQFAFLCIFPGDQPTNPIESYQVLGVVYF
jgi:hypothetical protein